MEFEWKFKFLMKNYEVCVGMVAIPSIWWPLDGFYSLTCWVWCQIQLLVENLCNYMERWLKYILFGGHEMGFVP
jgi:hypothetical protein